MKIIKNILLFPIKIVKLIMYGFYYLCLITAKGYYFYFLSFFKLITKIFKFKGNFLNNIIKHFEKRQQQPEYLLLLIIYIIATCSLYSVFYQKPDKTVRLDNYSTTFDNRNKSADSDENKKNNKTIIHQDNNLFRRFSSINIENVDFPYLKTINSDTVAWLSVDGTNINYPIVQNKNNEYYLSHSFDNTIKSTGWVYMDFRNNYKSLDNNTIFYGHNLINKTSFGSLSNLFTDNWLDKSNKAIVLLTENEKYLFKVFSIYEIEPETYYLQNKFNSDADYQTFLSIIKSRNQVKLNEDVEINDKIITLSTCTNDNLGRVVVHAKLVKEKIN